MAPDGTVFVALSNGDREVQETGPAGGRIAAFSPTGERVKGWPVQLPERTHATRIGWSAEGPVIAPVAVCAERLRRCGAQGAPVVRARWTADAGLTARCRATRRATEGRCVGPG